MKNSQKINRRISMKKMFLGAISKIKNCHCEAFFADAILLNVRKTRSPRRFAPRDDTPKLFLNWLLLVSILLLANVYNSTAQMFEKNEKQSGNNNSTIPPLTGQLQNLTTPILDGPVDPREYRVGPGDIFNVSILASTPLNFQIPVTPEGTIIIPTVGEVALSGMPLDSAKEKALKEIKKKYILGTSSFTLFSPRTFSVMVKGALKEEGVRYVQSTQRVDVVVNYRRDFSEPMDTTIAQRKIIIRHRNGAQSIADIEKYYATGNTLYNPLLRDGDVVIVPYRNIQKDFVSVYGAVNRQGMFEFVEGDSLSSIVSIARGLAQLADSDRIVITRVNRNNKLDTFALSYKKIVNKESEDVLLQRGDRIIVYEIYTNNKNSKVMIEGEVFFPGYYPIARDSTFLSEIILKAGGITQRASLKNSQLYRRSVNWSEIAVERMESARGGITPDDSAYYYLETDIRINRELVVSNFTELIQKNNTSKDVLLRDGDIINIASKKKTVYVFGQIVNPGHVLYEEGKDFNFYIAQTGGLTEYARSGDIKIIKASTRQWLSPNETTIEEGDYVWVPKEPYRPFNYYLTVYSQVFGIVATVVSLFVLVTR